jgi:hypothetical protein
MAIAIVGNNLAKNVFAVHGDLPTDPYLGPRQRPKQARL